VCIKLCNKVNIVRKIYFSCRASNRATVPDMRKPETKASAVRLTLDHWVKLRQLMQAYGRVWLEKIIDREHKKLGAK
jgi:hypothetical protein